MNRITRKFILMIAAAAVTISLAGCGSFRGMKIEDPEGRYYFSKVDTLEQESTDGTYHHFVLPDRGLHTYFSAEPAKDIDSGLKRTFGKAGFNFADYQQGGNSGMGDWNLRIYFNPENDHNVAVAFQERENTTYTFLVVADDRETDPSMPPSPIMKLLSSFRLTEKAGKPFTLASQEEVEDYITEEARRNGGSISVAVLKDDDIVYTFAEGERNLNTPTGEDVAYNWGSITKLMTATAIMQLDEKGLIDLEAPVNRYIPELSGLSEEVKVWNLLTHSSGLPDYEVTHIIGCQDVPVPEIEEVLGGNIDRLTALVFEPGTTTQYSNWNFLLLGIIVQRISGLTFTDYVDQNVISKLKMENTAYFYQDLPGPDARSTLVRSTSREGFLHVMESNGLDGEAMITAETEEFMYMDQFNILPVWGGLKGTAEDTVRFAELFLDKGMGPEERILEARTVRRMTAMQKSVDNEPLGMGLGWMLGRDGFGSYAEHGGGGPGINSLLRFYPKKNLAIAIMANFNDYNPEVVLKYTIENILK